MKKLLRSLLVYCVTGKFSSLLYAFIHGEIMWSFSFNFVKIMEKRDKSVIFATKSKIADVNRTVNRYFSNSVKWRSCLWLGAQLF